MQADDNPRRECTPPQWSNAMTDLTNISQFDLYFLSRTAAPLVVGHVSMLAPVVTPRQGEGWEVRLQSDTDLFREAVERLIREATETTHAVNVVEQASSEVSDWRQLTTGLARLAHPSRRQVLMRAAGWGLGSARTVKELKDLLLKISSRMAVHDKEFVALGLEPVLLELPGRVLRKLEEGAGDVARERAEDSLARADVSALYGLVRDGISAGWRGAELVAMQSRLLAGRDDISLEEKAKHLALAAQAQELVVKLEAALGEAKVQARKRAATETLPPGLADPTEAAPEEVEESAA